MKARLAEHIKMAVLGWLATVATALCFLPTITNQSYLPAAALICALLVAIGVGMRTVRTPALIVLAVQLLALTEILIVAFGNKLRFGVVPTAETLRILNDRIASGMDIAQRYAAPAPRSTGLTLLVIFAIGVACVLVDFFALGVRRVPLSGLPLLTLYTVPVTALTDGVPVYGFLPGAVAYIALLLADERDRLAHWGRLVSRTTAIDEQTVMDTSGLAASGRKISALAVVTAVVLPIFIPSLSSSLLDRGRGTGLGSGDGDQLSFADPMVSLAQSLRRPEEVDILEVKADVAPEYLRLVILDQPGPDSWTASTLDLSTTVAVNNVLPPPKGLSDRIKVTTHNLSVVPTDDFPSNSSWLPVPFGASYLSINNDWAYVPRDQTVTAMRETAASRLNGYTVNYRRVEPTADDLRSAGAAPNDIREEFGGVPGDMPQQIASTASAVTSGATTAYDEALLLQDFFRDSSNFSYDVDAAYGYGYQAMTEFLDKGRGFCQQFSATMTMMARTLGIPARIVVGFLQPERVDGETFVFTSHNVHSWPELYFDGVGWVRFEPTPGVGAPVPPYARNVTPGSELPSVNPTQGSLEEPTRNVNPENSGSSAPDDGAASGGSADGIPSRWWFFGAVALVLLLLPAALRFGVRRSRLTRPVELGGAAESAWLELRDHVRDLRLPWTGSMTPRARARSLVGLLAGDASGILALNRLSMSVERSRYATSGLAGADPAVDVVQVMAVIDKGAERSQRIRATFLPTSLLPDLRRAWRQRIGRRHRSTGQLDEVD